MFQKIKTWLVSELAKVLTPALQTEIHLLRAQLNSLSALDVGFQHGGKVIFMARVNGIDRVKIFDIPKNATLDQYKDICQYVHRAFGAKPTFMDMPLFSSLDELKAVRGFSVLHDTGIHIHDEIMIPRPGFTHQPWLKDVLEKDPEPFTKATADGMMITSDQLQAEIDKTRASAELTNAMIAEDFFNTNLGQPWEPKSQSEDRLNRPPAEPPQIMDLIPQELPNEVNLHLVEEESFTKSILREQYAKICICGHPLINHCAKSEGGHICERCDCTQFRRTRPTKEEVDVASELHDLEMKASKGELSNGEIYKRDDLRARVAKCSGCGHGLHMHTAEGKPACLMTDCKCSGWEQED